MAMIDQIRHALCVICALYITQIHTQYFPYNYQINPFNFFPNQKADRDSIVFVEDTTKRATTRRPAHNYYNYDTQTERPARPQRTQRTTRHEYKRTTDNYTPRTTRRTTRDGYNVFGTIIKRTTTERYHSAIYGNNDVNNIYNNGHDGYGSSNNANNPYNNGYNNGQNNYNNGFNNPNNGNDNYNNHNNANNNYNNGNGNYNNGNGNYNNGNGNNNNGNHEFISNGVNNNQNGVNNNYNGVNNNNNNAFSSNNGPNNGYNNNNNAIVSNNGFNNNRQTTKRPINSRQSVSQRKCEEYSNLVYEDIAAIPLLPNPEKISVSVANCNYTGVPLIVGGTPASLGEFPHMAAVGFDDGNGVIEWACGAALVSEQYVVTAAHCTSTDLGPPIRVRLGALNLKREVPNAKPIELSIAQIIKHPDYHPPIKYNDIALLKLSNKVRFTDNIRPACLYTQPQVQASKAVATGWGKIDFAEGPSDKLLKVVLSVIDNRQCKQLYQTERTLPDGIRDTMMCAGELAGGRDTCQGDSGGPLTIASKNNRCVYYVVGVTSFGKSCAGVNSPGVYTRMSSFVKWIESVVWPYD